MQRIAWFSPRWLSVIRLSFLCVLVTLPLPASASPHIPAGTQSGVFADNDGDGISNDLDPDDDNDGTPDIDDSNPLVPGSSSPADPGYDDPGSDSDSDGITNVLDPDDDNDAVADENEPAAPAPSNPGDGTSSPPGSNGSSSTGSSQSSSQGDSPMIQALPVTGVGPNGTVWPLETTLVVLALLFVICLRTGLVLQRSQGSPGAITD